MSWYAESFSLTAPPNHAKYVPEYAKPPFLLALTPPENVQGLEPNSKSPLTMSSVALADISERTANNIIAKIEKLLWIKLVFMDWLFFYLCFERVISYGHRVA